MNIHTGARRLLISFVCVFMAFLLLVGSFPAQASKEDSAGEIPVVKRWEGGEGQQHPHPDADGGRRPGRRQLAGQLPKHPPL